MRIAICFYGQMRLLELVRDYYPKLNEIQTDYSFDFFISTWNDYTHSNEFSNFTDFERVSKNSIYLSDKGNTPKFCYLLYRVSLLKQKYEINNNFKYDLVILMRPDVLLNFDDLISEIEKIKSKNYTKNFLLTLDDIIIDSDNNSYRLGSDFLFIGDSTSVDIHCTMYNFFFLEKKHLKTNMNFRIGGHWIHPFYINYNQFINHKMKIQSFLVRPKADIGVLKEYIDDVESLFSKIPENRKKFIQDTNDNELWIDSSGKKINFKSGVV